MATWKLQATKLRVRDVKANATWPGHTVTERYVNSTMVISWTVAPAGRLVGHGLRPRPA
jgi:hypothetical protein